MPPFCLGPAFHEELFPNVTVTYERQELLAQRTALDTMYSYAVVNRGEAPVLAQVEISPDGVHYAPDESMSIQPHATGVLVPKRYLRYTRLVLRTPQAAQVSLVDVYFQAQTRVQPN
ncbi:MAG: hypothetical protein BLITH_1459 [Brockia lithotrophica]|uniref:DUF6385 domain-containing protein n=1 Tax=Brockia lithotrophica TaxID=933949 RepID=A0A2T5G5B4_9BACL|nr:MAG: hypothetical protein BLITH_1459 [Brockia lithotrophica]